MKFTVLLSERISKFWNITQSAEIFLKGMWYLGIIRSSCEELDLVFTCLLPK